ncbi:MAG: ABC transporter ATP-binding protein [Nitrososphaerota archaeon]|nr:ABC transporter ATP-binding protein [Candidatus Bathyarchaeota archaeon]MDW8048730.1 ABC transporter ATP-binding protein [Nitrososphaerota archaeon]
MYTHILQRVYSGSWRCFKFPKIRLRNISKRFGEIIALERVNLEIEDKEYLCIIGPSGCGKTTLIKCIAGIIEPTEGEIYVDGKMINHVPIHDRGVGYVFQDIALFPHMSVYENVSYGPMVKGLEPSKSKDLVREILSLMALSDRAKDRPTTLSGGAQQKTAIARALASGSLLLLFDEPLGSLDAKVRSVLRHELRRMVKDLGLTAIHVTHDQQEAMAIADRIVIMRGGRIVEVGAPIDLYLRPKELFTANFLGEANFFLGEIVGEENGEVRIETSDGTIGSREAEVKGVKVVACIRPEFVIMKRRDEPKHGSWKGKIVDKVFASGFIRFEIMTEGGNRVVSKKPVLSHSNKWNLNETVHLEFPSDHVLLYPYPSCGLERAISIE